MLTVIEKWLPITGFPGYEISSFGRVRSIDRLGYGGRKLVGRILKTSTTQSGHMQVPIRSASGALVTILVHRVVLTEFVGHPPQGLQCCHNDGDKSNNVPSNLRWGTAKENKEDMRKHGTLPVGEKHPNSKLSDNNVQTIRASSLPAKDLAAELGVTRVTIYRIKNGRGWVHI